MSSSDPTTTCTDCGEPATRLRRGKCNRCYLIWWKNARDTGEFESTRVDLEPVQEHIAALMAAGLTPEQIAKDARIEARRVQMIVDSRGDRGGQRTHATRHVAEAIFAIPVPGADVVAALGTVRRIQALITIGYPMFELAYRLRVDEQEISRIAMRRPTIINPELDAAVRALYDQCYAVPGPNDDARNLGRRMGWASSFAWEDTAALDNPAARPDGVPPRPGVWQPIPADFPEVVADHRSRGRTDNQIAAELGISRDALMKRYRKFGIAPRAVAS